MGHNDGSEPQDIVGFMANSPNVFFQPNEAFWTFLQGLPWKYKQFHDVGAGIGCLTNQMREKGYAVKAYDKYPRDKACIQDIQIIDVMQDWFSFNFLDCIILARPCHGHFVPAVLGRYLDTGEILYISKPCNVEIDLDGYHYEIVAYDVGRDHENVYRVWASHKTGLTFHVLDQGYGPEVWELDDGRYVGPGGGGFPVRGTEKILEVRKAQHFGMFYKTQDRKHDDKDIGWLAPDGSFYGCAYAAHDKFAESVLGCDVRQLERLGFCRLQGPVGSSNEPLYTRGRGDGNARIPLTPAQKRVLNAKGYKLVGFDDDDHADKDFKLVDPGVRLG